MTFRGLAVTTLAIGCGLIASVADGQTVGEILDSNLKAKGGTAVLETVQSVRQTLSVDMQGTTADVVVYSMRPNLLRQEVRVSGRTLIQAFDGQVAWARGSMMASEGAATLTGARAAALRAQAGFDGMLLSARADGTQVELVGTVVIDGRQAHHLRIIDDGQVRQCYLDALTSLELRIVEHTAAGRLQQDLSDYQEVGGIWMPFTIRTSLEGQPQSVATVTDVALNVPVDPALFVMPGGQILH
jgi:hypothetical protein